MTILSSEQRQFLAENRPHYETLIKAEFLTNINYQVKNGLLDIARAFSPGYQSNLWCGPCVCALIKFVYVQYDKWLSEQNIYKAIFPIQEKKDDVR